MSGFIPSYNDREQRSIILLSVIALVLIAVLIVLDSNESAEKAEEKADVAYVDRSTPPSYLRQQANESSNELHPRRFPDAKRHQERRYTKNDASRNVENSTEHERKYPSSNKFTKLTLVDANYADSATLTRIPGVGKYTAMSIIRQRDRLGGFHSVSQLLECRYFNEEALAWFTVGDNPPLRHLNINTADFKTLVSHPYIDKNQTLDIINYRRLYGLIKDSVALLGTRIFSEQELRAISPYIDY